jgi:hypothetical protein
MSTSSRVRAAALIMTRRRASATRRFSHHTRSPCTGSEASPPWWMMAEWAPGHDPGWDRRDCAGSAHTPMICLASRRAPSERRLTQERAARREQHGRPCCCYSRSEHWPRTPIAFRRTPAAPPAPGGSDRAPRPGRVASARQAARASVVGVGVVAGLTGHAVVAASGRSGVARS